jgi:hypothetical protein
MKKEPLDVRELANCLADIGAILVLSECGNCLESYFELNGKRMKAEVKVSRVSDAEFSSASENAGYVKW